MTLARRRPNSNSNNLSSNRSSHASRELRAGGADAVAEAPDANEAKAARRSSSHHSNNSAALQHRRHRSSRMRSPAAARVAVVQESAVGAGAVSADAVVALEMAEAVVELLPRHRNSRAASLLKKGACGSEGNGRRRAILQVNFEFRISNLEMKDS
ncbi:MAG: hypothetical protein ACXW2Q_00410 [Thermoanaerobaculia bacterium]